MFVDQNELVNRFRGQFIQRRFLRRTCPLLLMACVLVRWCVVFANPDTNISGTIATNTTLGPTSSNFTPDTVYIVTGNITVNAGDRKSVV